MTTKILGAVWPFMVFPLIIFLNLRGSLDFGAGEKDIVLAIPMLVFSIFYIITYLILIRRKQKIYISVIISSLFSFMLLVIITFVFAETVGVRG